MSGLLTCDNIFNLYTLFLREVQNFWNNPPAYKFLCSYIILGIFVGLLLTEKSEYSIWSKRTV